MIRLSARGAGAALALVATVLGLCACGRDPATAPAARAPAARTGASSETLTQASAPAQLQASSRRQLPANATFDYQIGGSYAPAPGVGIVDRDASDAPAPGRYSICYLNAFQTQPGRLAWWQQHHPSLLLREHGQPVHDPDWPDEVLLDISTARNRAQLLGVESPWLARCAKAGFAAVEPDNLDSWTRSGGLIRRGDAISFATGLVQAAHGYRLAIAQKNAPDLSAIGRRVIGFDFAVAEECQVYAECGSYTAAYGDRVIEIEYTDQPRSAYLTACRERGARISILLRDREVVPRGSDGYHDETC